MALQLRRGTNAERLAMTPLIGELIYVTDYELVTFNVTAIDAGTDTLTAVAHGLTVNQQIKFQDANLNGLILNQVYFVKTVPSSDTFTLSLTLGGSVIDITGTFTIPLVFAKTPTNAAGAPLGTNSTPLWVGDGVTVGGIVAASLNLDDLLDVAITSLAEGNILYYDATTGFWRNTAVVTVDDVNTRVGINDTSPSYTLDVNGVANVETSLTVPSITTLTGDDLNITAFTGREVTISTTTSNDPVTIERNTANTNVASRLLTLRHNTSAPPAIGIGGSLEFEVETTAGVVPASYIATVATNVGSGTESFTMNFGLMEAGAAYANVMSLDGLGNLQIDNNLTVSGNQIKNSAGTSVITFDTNETELIGDLQIKGNRIRNDSGNDTITMATGATGLVTLSGNLQVTGNNIKNSDGDSVITFDINDEVEFLSAIQIKGNLIRNSTGNDTISMGTGATGLVTLSGDLQVNGDDITTNQTTFNLLNATATTVNAFGASTSTAIGSTASGTTTIGYDLVVNNDLSADSVTVDNQASIDSFTLTTTSTATVSLMTTTRNAMSGLINIIEGTNVHCLNYTALRVDATTALLTTYGEMYNTSSLASFTADVSGGSLRLRVTPASATSTVFSVVRTSLT